MCNSVSYLDVQSSSLGAPAAGQAEEMWDASAARQAGREMQDLDFIPMGDLFWFLVHFVGVFLTLKLCKIPNSVEVFLIRAVGQCLTLLTWNVLSHQHEGNLTIHYGSLKVVCTKARPLCQHWRVARIVVVSELVI